jgi:uncharacterized protein YjbI with pentapeptide repeats
MGGRGMLARRNRDPLQKKTEPTPFAARAKDLGALRDAVVEAAGVGAGFWISYLFTLFYFAVAAGAVTHRDLLLESPVKLPFLNVELPLEAFFVLGPLVFLIVHAYVLLHLVFSSGKVGIFNAELQAQISGADARARLRRQLPSNIFVQSLAGPPEIRTVAIRVLLWLITRISLVFGPIALLIFFQLRFLPYHSEWITWWQRITVVIDIVLLWILWPSIALGETTPRRWNGYLRIKVRASLLVTILPFLLIAAIATFPGEWLESKLRRMQGRAMLHELLVAGPVNYVTGKPQSWWSNVLVVPNFQGGERALSLRGRSLEGAVLDGANLRNADFTGASLAGAKFTLADLREARFGFDWSRGGSPAGSPTGCSEGIRCTQLQGADFRQAQLQGASLARAQLQGARFSLAQLQGASLDQAQLQGAELTQAHLQGASLSLAQLQGAMLIDAQLEGTNLDQAQLQGANLVGAQLQGASLNNTQLQGAWLAGPPSFEHDARLDGASLAHTYVWRTYPPANPNGAFVGNPEPRPKYLFLDCPAGECDWSEKSYAALKSLIEDSVPLSGQRNDALRQIATLEKPPNAADDVAAEAWTKVAKEQNAPPGSYFNTLAEILKKVGCADDGAPYVIKSFMRPAGLGVGGVLPVNLVWLDQRFQGVPSQQEAELAAAFLDERKCLGARGLSEETRANLKDIRDRGLPAPAGPGIVTR